MSTVTTATTVSTPVVHRFQASLFPVNAYIVETAEGVVVVDATLGVSDGRALRRRVDALGKPLLAVLVTHAHPDHYGALSSLLEPEASGVPVIATNGVALAIRRDDPSKEEILRPMFGEEWAHARTFPDRTIGDGDRVTFGGATFRAIDLGPGESPHDSIWLLESDAGVAGAFVGDLVYSHMHGYLADGYWAQWLENIARVRRDLPADTMLYMGHGEPGSAALLLDWQERYINQAVEAVRSGEALEGAALVAAVTERIRRYLPTDDLLFLMQLSVEPMRARLQGVA